MVKNVDQCFPKPKVTSSNISFCPQLKDIQFSVPWKYWQLLKLPFFFFASSFWVTASVCEVCKTTRKMFPSWITSEVCGATTSFTVRVWHFSQRGNLVSTLIDQNGYVIGEFCTDYVLYEWLHVSVAVLLKQFSYTCLLIILYKVIFYKGVYFYGF